VSKEFYVKWFQEDLNKSFNARAEYYPGDKIGMVPLGNILGLDVDNLKPFTKELLELEIEDPLGQSINEIKKGYCAYTEFQDLLSISINLDSEENIDFPIEGRHYAYYESTIYLKEIIICLIENNVLAANVLMRPFLESSITNLYWKLKLDSSKYRDYYTWLENKNIKLYFRNMLDWTMDRLEASSYVPKLKYDQLRQSLLHFYKFISDYHHGPKQKNSIVTLSGGNENSSAYALMLAFYQLELVLNNICYLYILSYPNILYPVDAHKKFAFNPPVGFFADNSNYQIVESYIGTNNIEILRKQLSPIDSVSNLLKWFHDQKDLTEEQIEESWNDFKNRAKLKNNPKEIELRLLFAKSQSRAVGWAMNYLTTPENYDFISDEDVDKVMNFIKNWTK